MLKWLKDTVTRYGSTIVIGDNMRLDEDQDGRIRLSSTGIGVSNILDDLSDVTISAVADDQFLRYNIANSQWINQLITAADVGAGTFKDTTLYTFNSVLAVGAVQSSPSSEKLQVYGGTIFSGSVRQVGSSLIRVEGTGAGVPTGATGPAIEIAGNTALASPPLLQAFNRSTGAFVGMSLRANQFDFYNTSLNYKLTSTDWSATADNAKDLGQPSLQWADLYIGTKVSTPLVTTLTGSTSLAFSVNTGSTWMIIGSGALIGVGLGLPLAGVDLSPVNDVSNFAGYTLIRSSSAVADRGGVLISNGLSMDGVANSFKINSTFNGSTSGRARLGFIINNSTETWLNNGPILELKRLSNDLLINQGSTGNVLVNTTTNPLIFAGQAARIINSGTMYNTNDLRIGVLGTFDYTSVPSSDYLLSYNGTKWIARFLQTSFAVGNVNSAGLSDGSTVAVIDDGRTLSGAPVAPTIAPVITSVYKGLIVDMSSYGALAAGQKFVIDYSINSGSTFTNAAITTIGNRMVHSNLHPEWGYIYKFKIRGASDSTYSPNSAITQPSYQAEVNAFGLITASQISTINLSAISANIGNIIAGTIQNGANTAGIRIDSGSTLPTSWLTYMDLAATGSSTFIKVLSALKINANGSAIFSGTIQASSALITILTVTGPTIFSGQTAASRMRWATTSVDYSNLNIKRMAYGEDGSDSLIFFDTGASVENARFGDYTLTGGAVNQSDNSWSPNTETVTLSVQGSTTGANPVINSLGGSLPAVNNQFVVNYQQVLDTTGISVDLFTGDPLCTVVGYVDLMGSTDGVNYSVLITDSLTSQVAQDLPGSIQTVQYTKTVSFGSAAASVWFKVRNRMTRSDFQDVSGSATNKVTVNSATGNVTWTNGGTTVSRRNLRLGSRNNNSPQMMFNPSNTVPLSSVTAEEGSLIYASGSFHQFWFNDGGTSIGRWRRIAVQYTDWWRIRAHNGSFQGVGVPTPTLYSGTFAAANSSNGIFTSCTTGATTGAKSGWITAGGEYTRLDHEPLFIANVTLGSDITNYRTWVGLTSVQQPANSDTPNGVVAMFRYSDGTMGGRWMGIVSNGGVVSGTTIIDAGAAGANNIYILKIRYTNGNVIFSVNNGQEYPINSNIPSTSTALAVECSVMTKTTAAKRLDLGAVECSIGS